MRIEWDHQTKVPIIQAEESLFTNTDSLLRVFNLRKAKISVARLCMDAEYLVKGRNVSEYSL